MFKKGAMFGLDARIALAIFGALSVISGAALYSAIQDAKITQLITEFNELGKAVDQYYLDIGENLPMSSSRWVKVRDLVRDNSKNGWNGPYLNWETSADHLLEASSPGSFLAIYSLDGTWTSNVGDFECGTGTVGGSCYLWLGVFGNEDLKSMIDVLDEKIDGAVDYNNGNIRYSLSASDTPYIYFKYMPKQGV
jgi:type II secretory pathway pseudopilin PulG